VADGDDTEANKGKEDVEGNHTEANEANEDVFFVSFVAFC
jgi:hypothetical protein